MNATVKCSNCGAEITNLHFSWGRKQWIWILPVIVISFLPMWRLFKPKGDFRQDLQITVLEKRLVDQDLQVLGHVSNQGKTRWDNIDIDCLFFDSKGAFIDKASGRVNAVVMPDGKEYFKISTKDPSGRLGSPEVQIEAKIADAYSSPF